MSTASVVCNKCGNVIELNTELLNSDLSLIADSLAAENDKLEEQIKGLELWIKEGKKLLDV